MAITTVAVYELGDQRAKSGEMPVRIEFLRADVPGCEKILIESDYILTVKSIFENGQRKWTEIRMKAGFVEVVQETYDEVKAKLPSTLP